MTLAPGTRLGCYEVLSPVGAGGMGEVYRARDLKLERFVAVKVLPETLANDAKALARFEREAKAVAALSHPNIMAIHDFGSENGIAFAAMALLEGRTLREWIADGRVPLRKAIAWAREIAVGLAAAHARGIVHRDLKPDNVFVTKEGHVKLLDFGLAKRVVPPMGDVASARTEQRTEPGMVVGTVSYMSPEQVHGEDIDHR